MSMLHERSVGELAKALRSREIKATELLSQTFKRIEKLNPELNCFLRIRKEAALQEAGSIDTRLDNGESCGALAGIPLAIKDNMVMAGENVTAGSKILEDFVSPFSATVVERLREAGAIIVGHTNMDEFAMGSSNENSAYGGVKNPWDLSRVAGGSSGGSAAAVAACCVPLSLGSDTGGSVRLPAAFCGVVGMKPSYGSVSRYGLIAFASSLDQIGPFAHSVADTALVLDAIAGHDALESTSRPRAGATYTKAMGNASLVKVVGYPKEYLATEMEADVRGRFEESLATIESLGIKTKEISLPHSEFAVPCYYVIATAEASSNLSRFDGIRYGSAASVDAIDELFTVTRSNGFGDEVKRRIMLGTFVLSSGYCDAYYKKATTVRQLIRQDFIHAFSECDAIVSPTSPSVAFRLAEKTDDPVKMYLSDVFTTAASLAGMPAMNLPIGQGSKGLPIGLQIIGPYQKDLYCLQLARQLEPAFEQGIACPLN